MDRNNGQALHGGRPAPGTAPSGCRTSKSGKRLVRNWVESAGRPVTFYQAVHRDGAFALDIEQID